MIDISLSCVSNWTGMYKINDKLAIYGFNGNARNTNPEMRYCNQEIGEIDGFKIVDVRMLNDGNNSLEEYKLNIERVLSWLRDNTNVVVCCDTGKSRSNAIALAVLVKYFKLNFYDAWELIKQKVPISNVNPSLISDLKKLFTVSLP
jgi:Dual specificity phosphatase, catalytic domain